MSRIVSLVLLLLLTCGNMDSSFAQWVQANAPTANTVSCFAVNGVNLFAGTQNGGIFRSADNGTTWTAVDSGLTNLSINSLATSDTNLFVATLGGVFLSTNNGTSWTAVTSSLAFSLAVSGVGVFAGTTSNVILSTDNGTTWRNIWTWASSGEYKQLHALAISGPNLFVGAYEEYGGGVFLSTKEDTNWTTVNAGLAYYSIFSLATSGANLLAGTNDGVYLSTDNGSSWTGVMTQLANNVYPTVLSFAVSGAAVFAGEVGGRGVSLSTDNGSSWRTVNEGLTNAYVSSLAISGENLFAGISGGGVWRRPLSEMITSVKARSDASPPNFVLGQNFPNPFNPSTVITYQLSTSAFVSLTVFDILGKKVGTLVHERQNAGSHAVTFNAENLPSGIYFYRLQSGTFAETRKLAILK